MRQNRQPIGWRRGSQHPEQRGLHGDAGAVREGSGKWSPGVLPVTAPDPVLPPFLLHIGSCDRNRGAVSVWRSFQDDASGRGEGCEFVGAVGTVGLLGCRAAGVQRLWACEATGPVGRQKKRPAGLRVVSHSFQ